MGPATLLAVTPETIFGKIILKKNNLYSFVKIKRNRKIQSIFTYILRNE